MRKEDFRTFLDNIKPTETEKNRMLHNILNHSYRKKDIFMAPFKLKN